MYVSKLMNNLDSFPCNINVIAWPACPIWKQNLIFIIQKNSSASSNFGRSRNFFIQFIIYKLDSIYTAAFFKGTNWTITLNEKNLFMSLATLILIKFVLNTRFKKKPNVQYYKLITYCASKEICPQRWHSMCNNTYSYNIIENASTHEYMSIQEELVIRK